MSRKKRVKKNVKVVVNKFGTTGLVYSDSFLAEEFRERMEVKYPDRGPWTVQDVVVTGYPSETDLDLVYDYLYRRKKVNRRTPRSMIVSKAMDYFSEGNYSLDFCEKKGKWVVCNKVTGKSYSDAMPMQAIQAMLRQGGNQKVKRRLTESH